jgi:hypothetical protein
LSQASFRSSFLRRTAVTLSAFAMIGTIVGVSALTHAERHSSTIVSSGSAQCATASCQPLPAGKQQALASQDAAPSAKATADLPTTHVVAPLKNLGTTTQIAAIERDVMADFYAADQAEVMPTVVSARVAAASTAGFAAAQGRALGDAWAPSVVAAQTQELVQAMQATASDPHAPSFIGSKWTVVQWQGVAVSGSAAKAVFIADEQENFSGGDGTVPPGWFDEGTEQWSVDLQLVGNQWLMTSRSAAVDQVGSGQ